MRETAREKGVCTQMGNQGTAEPGFRRGAEVIRRPVELRVRMHAHGIDALGQHCRPLRRGDRLRAGNRTNHQQLHGIPISEVLFSGRGGRSKRTTGSAGASP